MKHVVFIYSVALTLCTSVFSTSLHDPFQKPSAPAFTLHGIARSATHSVCLLSSGNNQKVCSLGENFEGYTIQNITSTTVTLRAPLQCITLTFS